MAGRGGAWGVSCPGPSLAKLLVPRPWAWIGLAALSFFGLLSYFRSGPAAGVPSPAGRAPGGGAPDPAGGLEPLLIYNRIPKTASTTLMHLPYELCQPLGYHVLLLNITRPPHLLTLQDRVFFARNITQWRAKRPALYHGHFGFIDFDLMGLSGPAPIYINMIRRPLDRLVSYYYFLRYGDDFRVNKIRSRMGDKMTFDECVERRLGDCDPKKLWLQIPWFCGHFKQCWEPGNRWALEQAKFNLVHKYFLVGVTEELETFIELLEMTLPRFFQGATRMYQNSASAQHIRKTQHKETPTEATVDRMKSTKVWKMENEFYEFAYSHFLWLKAEYEQTRGARMFHYEKIRP
eukprot:maker-scaffold801_size95070-snap-gene-0.18 protein:Tk01647 transcript:maker-scaffold801_size95070-snap-gene-0.18-mRNA-1 annotation:"heparin sulfate o-sulfotransferase-like"